MMRKAFPKPFQRAVVRCKTVRSGISGTPPLSAPNKRRLLPLPS